MAEATAAPAAPSGSATTADAGGPQSSPGQADAGIPTVPAAAKSARPIPSPPRGLPGVFPDDDPFPPPPSRSSTSPADSPLPRGERGRDASGRFLPAGASPAQSGNGEHTPETADAADPTLPAKFKFAGEEYDSQDAAEQNIRSLRGQYRPIMSLAKNLGGVDRILPTFTKAAESARGWKAEAERLTAELAAARSGAPAPTPAVNPTDQPTDADAADVDWELYAEVKKLATQSGEPWKAEQWLIEQVRKSDRANTQRLLADTLKPFVTDRAQQERTAQTETLFTSLAEYTNSDGSAAFPELHDEAASYEVGKMWASLGLPHEFALTPQGAVAAIAIYRMAKGNPARPAATTSTPPPQPPATPSAQPTDSLSAATLTDGRPTSVSLPGVGAPSAEAARILSGLRSANSGSRSALGFDA